MVSIIRFAGSNCEFDVQHACEILNIESAIVWHKDNDLPKETTVVVLPGGFSYGDYLRCGAIARFSPIMKRIKDFASNGGVVLGICNGFQILCESALLPGALRRNENLHYIAKSQKLKIINNDNIFLRSYGDSQVISLPIAHAEGNYFIDEKGLDSLRDNHQILLEYVENPNGSTHNIAGICNKDKNVFGLMPHPERAVEAILGGEDGVDMLVNIFSAQIHRIA